MFQQKRRLIALAFIMVFLVGSMSMFSTWLLYRTSLGEQQKRLYELVQSQASLAVELETILLKVGRVTTDDTARAEVLNALVRAHRKFQIDSNSGEFTVGKKISSNIQFLIVNGEKVPSFSQLYSIPLASSFAEPMKRALFGESGTMVGLDYNSNEVLAAYTPLKLGNESLGLVAKIDIDEIKAPFFAANFTVFGVGLVFTLLGLFVFFKLSEPIIQEIQESEKKYRDLVEGANSLILRINRKGVISFANQFATNLLPTDSSKLIGLNFLQVLTADPSSLDGSERVEDVLSFFGNGEGPHEMCTPDIGGENVCISWTIRKILNANGEINELLCIGNDISAKFKAREAQIELEERFRGIAKASPVGIVITDINGNLLYANERMHTLTGQEASELAGQGWLNRIQLEDRLVLQKNWYDTRSISIDRMEFRLTHRTGNELWILGQIVGLKNSNDDLVGYVITLTDITQIKDTESEQKRLTAAIDQAAEVILITDLDGLITYVNPAFEKVTGYTRQEAIGKSPSILKSGEQDTDFYKQLWSTINDGQFWSGRFVNVKKDGHRYTQDATIGPVRNDKGETISYVMVARDISNQLIIEAQLRQAQKLESIGELAAGIAHEINTPTQYVNTNMQFMVESFTTLMGMIKQCEQLVQAVKAHQPIEKLLQLAESALDEKKLDYLTEDIPSALNESQTGLKRIAEIVLSVKQLAHPGEITKSFHSLNEIVTNAITVSSNEWKYVAEINLDLDDTLPDIYCLKGEIGQVVLNLIINGAHAIETKMASATKEKGQITITTNNAGDWAVLKVTDSGTGMSPHVVEHAFDPFYTTKEVGKGTGQGLAITHNVVVNMHGGSVEVETEEGKGSTFIIKLPFEGQ